MTKKHRRRRNWSQLALLLIFAVAAIYAAAHCMFRAPELQSEKTAPAAPIDEISAEEAANMKTNEISEEARKCIMLANA